MCHEWYRNLQSDRISVGRQCPRRSGKGSPQYVPRASPCLERHVLQCLVLSSRCKDKPCRCSRRADPSYGGCELPKGNDGDEVTRRGRGKALKIPTKTPAKTPSETPTASRSVRPGLWASKDRTLRGVVFASSSIWVLEACGKEPL